MIKTIVTRITQRMSEFVLAVVIVIVCFALFLVILNLSFPEATSLRDLLRTGPDELASGSARATSGGAASNPLERPPDRALIARLGGIVRRVKDRSPTDVAWTNSADGTRLANGHAVQTMARSSASIVFDDSSSVKLGENTLLVVQRLSSAGSVDKRTASLVVVAGEVLGHSGGGKDAAGVDVTVGGGGATLHLAPGGNTPTSFRVTAEADQSATFTVFEGEALVRAGGRTIPVGRRQFLRVDDDGEAIGPARRLDVVEPLAPEDGQAYVFRTLAPSVEFRWAPVADADRYRLTIAQDDAFERVVHDGPVAGTTFRYGNLRAGVYWWRVRAGVGAADGPASAPRRLEIQQDDEPPTLRVAFPDGAVVGPVLTLRGEVEPGASVFCGEHSVTTDARGAFSSAVRLEPGVNVIVVQAVDRAGNVAYASRLITARYGPN